MARRLPLFAGPKQLKHVLLARYRPEASTIGRRHLRSGESRTSAYVIDIRSARIGDIHPPPQKHRLRRDEWFRLREAAQWRRA